MIRAHEFLPLTFKSDVRVIIDEYFPAFCMGEDGEKPEKVVATIYADPEGYVILSKTFRKYETAHKWAMEKYARFIQCPDSSNLESSK